MRKVARDQSINGQKEQEGREEWEEREGKGKEEKSTKSIA